jgi:hypothetical protein
MATEEDRPLYVNEEVEAHRVKMAAIKRQIEWRRGKVAEYDAKGFSQHDIADILKVSVGTINGDMMWLRAQASENIKTYTQQTLPHLFDKSLIGLTQVLREAWLTSTTTKYERNKILALSLVKDCLTARVDLASNADVIDKTALFVARKRKTLEQLEADEEEYEELPTPPNTEPPIIEAEPEQQEREMLH